MARPLTYVLCIHYYSTMSKRRTGPRTANLLGAFVLLARDRMQSGLASDLEAGESGQAAILTIGTRPGRTIDALRRTLGITHSAAVRLVENAVRQGLVAKRPGPDRRSASLALTARGERLFAKLTASRHAVMEELLSVLTHGQRRNLAEALEVMLTGTAETRDDAHRICRFCDHGVCLPCPVGSSVRRDDS